MAVIRTSLSAGEVIRALLLEDPAVHAITTRVFPVVSDSAEMPCVVYRRTSLTSEPTKAGYAGADTAVIEVICFSASYGEGITLAEAVRKALDCTQVMFTDEASGAISSGVWRNSKPWHDEDLWQFNPLAGSIRVRGCALAGSDEGYEGDAYYQRLIFNVKL